MINIPVWRPTAVVAGALFQC